MVRLPTCVDDFSALATSPGSDTHSSVQLVSGPSPVAAASLSMAGNPRFPKPGTLMTFDAPTHPVSTESSSPKRPKTPGRQPILRSHGSLLTVTAEGIRPPSSAHDQPTRALLITRGFRRSAGGRAHEVALPTGFQVPRFREQFRVITSTIRANPGDHEHRRQTVVVSPQVFALFRSGSYSGFLRGSAWHRIVARHAGRTARRLGRKEHGTFGQRGRCR